MPGGAVSAFGVTVPGKCMPSPNFKPSLKGQRFGKLLVLHRRRDNDDYRRIRWVCKCDCGKKYEAAGYTLRGGQTKSCRDCSYPQGCLSKKYAREYSCWQAMRSRCLCKTNNAYKWYGGRGIKICPQWLGPGGLAQFVMDMGRRPKDRTLDRENPEGNYEPTNCKWSTDIQQANNKRCSYTEEELVEMREEARLKSIEMFGDEEHMF
jgi:hypothetical protein